MIRRRVRGRFTRRRHRLHRQRAVGGRGCQLQRDPEWSRSPPAPDRVPTLAIPGPVAAPGARSFSSYPGQKGMQQGSPRLPPKGALLCLGGKAFRGSTLSATRLPCPTPWGKGVNVRPVALRPPLSRRLPFVVGMMRSPAVRSPLGGGEAVPPACLYYSIRLYVPHPTKGSFCIGYTVGLKSHRT